MRRGRFLLFLSVFSFFLAGAFFGAAGLLAHCDTMDGPVVKAARKALETGRVELVAVWVQKSDEAEVGKAFEKTRAVRKLSGPARDLADMYFFETVVRLHRAGEGAPYTGLKPAGTDLGPVIPASDRAIERGSVKELLKRLGETMQANVAKHFQELMARKNYNENDVDAGRRFVKANVLFTHYVEAIHEAAKGPSEAHGETVGREVHK